MPIDFRVGERGRIFCILSTENGSFTKSVEEPKVMAKLSISMAMYNPVVSGLAARYYRHRLAIC